MPQEAREQVMNGEAANTDRRTQWRQVMEQTQAMLDLARRGEWEALITLENGRQETIRKFFSSPVTHAEAEWMSEELPRLIAMGNEISAITSRFRDQIAGELGRLNHSLRALHAYQGVRY